MTEASIDIVTNDQTEPPVGLAGDLAAAGASPITADVAAMMAQIQAMQRQIAEMQAERGIPADPVAAAVQDLKSHVSARVEATGMHHPQHDYLQILVKTIKNLSDSPEYQQVEFIRTLFDDVKHHLEGLPYLKDLALKLAQEVLKARPAVKALING